MCLMLDDLVWKKEGRKRIWVKTDEEDLINWDLTICGRYGLEHFQISVSAK